MTWVVGYPYPALQALPYVLVTAQGMQVYGSTTQNISVSSITDQNGNDASSVTDTSATYWITNATATDNVGGGFVIGGAGGTVSAGYQLTYTGTLTVTPAPITVTALGGSST